MLERTQNVTELATCLEDLCSGPSTTLSLPGSITLASWHPKLISSLYWHLHTYDIHINAHGIPTHAHAHACPHTYTHTHLSKSPYHISKGKEYKVQNVILFIAREVFIITIFIIAILASFRDTINLKKTPQQTVS